MQQAVPGSQTEHDHPFLAVTGYGNCLVDVTFCAETMIVFNFVWVTLLFFLRFSPASSLAIPFREETSLCA